MLAHRILGIGNGVFAHVKTTDILLAVQPVVLVVHGLEQQRLGDITEVAEIDILIVLSISFAQAPSRFVWPSDGHRG